MGVSLSTPAAPRPHLGHNKGLSLSLSLSLQVVRHWRISVYRSFPKTLKQFFFAQITNELTFLRGLKILTDACSTVCVGLILHLIALKMPFA